LRGILTGDFLFIFAAHFLFSMAFGGLLPVLPLYLKHLSYDDTQIGLLTGVFAIAAVILRPLAGAALQRYSAKLITIAGSLLCGLTFLAYLFGTTFWFMLFVRLVQGAAFALVTTACTAAVVDISPVELRGRSLSYFLLSINIATVVTPGLGILFVNHFSFRPFFIILFVLCVGCLVTIFGLKGPVKPAEKLTLVWSDFFSRPAVPAGLASFGLQVIWGTVSTFLPLMALEKGISNPGLFFTAMAAAMVICRTLGARILDRHNRLTIITVCLVMLLVDLVILSLSSTQAMFILVGILFGISFAFLIPSFMAHATQHSGSSAGASIGTFLGLCDAGQALGPMIMGAVAATKGYSTTFLCTAFIASLNIFYSRFFLRERAVVQKSAR
jgi:MFS family permease